MAALLGTAAGAQTLSLSECIRIGIERNLSVERTRIEMAKGETGIKESFARLMPTVDGSIRLSDYLKEPVNMTTGALLGSEFPDQPTWQMVHSMPWQSSAMLSVQMPVWNESLRAAVDAARVVRDLRRIGYEKACEELTLQIAKVYYLMQGAQEQIRLLGEDVKRMQEMETITGSLLEQGVALEVDYQRIRININGLLTQQKQMQTLYEQQQNTLKFLLDDHSGTGIVVEDQSAQMDEMPLEGLSSSLPDLQLAENSIKLTDRQRKVVRAGYLPSLALFGQAGYLGYQEKLKDFFRKHESNWFGTAVVGLQLSAPIFDAGQKRLRLRQLGYEKEQAELTLQSLRSQQEQQYANARLQLVQNERTYALQTDNRKQARDVYQLTAMRYQEGVASMTELLQDDMRLITAEQQVVNALTQWNLARLELLRLEKRLEELK